jgi:5'-deoxynucleotidase YfbR-like HD superfamily hydrolase
MKEQLSIIEKLEFVRKGGMTKRYHTKNTIHANTVGHHSFGVAWICTFLSESTPSANLLLAALSHDLAEQVTGDISSPTKRKFPAMAEMIQTMETETLGVYHMDYESELTVDEARILKMADCLDGALFCISEMELGNQGIKDVYGRYCDYIFQLEPTGLQHHVFSAVRIIGDKYVR